MSIRKRVAGLSLLAILFITMLVPLQMVKADSVETSNIKVYRMYFKPNGEHLYTTSYNEARTLSKLADWVDEGDAWYSPRVGTPVYRLFNPFIGKHLYTTDKNEVKVLTTYQGWKADFNGEPAFYSGGSVRVYRLYNSELQMHHLTTDAKEYSSLAHEGWTQEGVALFGTTPTFSQDQQTGTADITNVPAEYAIEADVKLSGSGVGYHAKLVAVTPTSGVSFGIQYDREASGAYKDATTFIIENVMNNNHGGQNYPRTGYSKLNTTYKMLLAVQADGSFDVYVNGAKVGSGVNPKIAHQKIYLRVEGSGKYNGDRVNASFTNIKIKTNGVYNPYREYGTYNFDTNKGLHSNDSLFKSDRQITIQGVLSGLKNGEDWDSAYEGVSGIIQFVE